MGCACYCHMPGCRVATADGDSCCACAAPERPSLPRPGAPRMPRTVVDDDGNPVGARVSPLSPAAPQGRKLAKSG